MLPPLTDASRPEPHKRLKKFLSPAFRVGYIDNLDFLFGKCIGDLIQKYQKDLAACAGVERDIPHIEIDIMDDVHSIGLDM